MLKMPQILTVMDWDKNIVFSEAFWAGTKIQTWEVQDGLFASEE